MLCEASRAPRRAPGVAATAADRRTYPWDHPGIFSLVERAMFACGARAAPDAPAGRAHGQEIFPTGPHHALVDYVPGAHAEAEMLPLKTELGRDATRPPGRPAGVSKAPYSVTDTPSTRGTRTRRPAGRLSSCYKYMTAFSQHDLILRTSVFARPASPTRLGVPPAAPPRRRRVHKAASDVRVGRVDGRGRSVDAFANGSGQNGRRASSQAVSAIDRPVGVRRCTIGPDLCVRQPRS